MKRGWLKPSGKHACFIVRKQIPLLLGAVLPSCWQLLSAAPSLKCSSSIRAETFTQHLDRQSFHLPLLLQARLVLAEEEFGADWIQTLTHLLQIRESLESWFL